MVALAKARTQTCQPRCNDTSLETFCSHLTCTADAGEVLENDEPALRLGGLAHAVAEGELSVAAEGELRHA